ncbi:MAG: hypothetical protein JSV58_04180 [Candidatus Bathyarchaeota archaeon]|nr:MAG: hypothetical protein JSV58_04180 [Candidatus Bathyarchaeota archaeon]
MFDLVTVGHFAIDLIASPATAVCEQALGGSPTYVSLTARKLGARVSVVSKVGEDFPNGYSELLKMKDVDLSGLIWVKGASTTKFSLKHRGDECQSKLLSQAPYIFVKDIPGSLQSRIIHVAPIAGEVSQAIVADLRAKTDLLSLDPQGFVRKVNRSGDIRLRKWNGTRILELVDLYKSSLDELRMVSEQADLRLAMKEIQDYGVGIVIVTMGIKGSMMLHEGVFCKVPACRPTVIRDLTGAGDAYAGAFLAELIRGKGPAWCSCVGSAAASFVVEGVGPAVFGEEKQIYKRAARIYEEGLSCLE